MPQVMRVFLGIAHDGGYHDPLSTLQLEGFIDKIVLLRAYNEEIARDLRRLQLKEARFEGLFLEQRVENGGGRGSHTRSLGQTVPPMPGPNPTEFIICLVDGNRNIFSQAQINNGIAGGRDMGTRLEASIRAHAGLTAAQAALTVTVVGDITNMKWKFPKSGLSSVAQLEGFIKGFSEYAPSFSYLDVPDGMDAGEERVRG
jgi:hypothetical protein